jgi:hypothetical protein
VSIGASHFDGISRPPRHAPAELKGLQAGDAFIVEKSKKRSEIMSIYLEALAHCMHGIAISFNICNLGQNSVIHFWIFSHLLAAQI